ncbi:MAG: carboxypeptidase-like regulatory domain-containing protein [Bacteroidota bacterium]|nr:carboxypeptidase-like regulatory domain-containing protein [Bacteroidota bacterium]
MSETIFKKNILYLLLIYTVSYSYTLADDISLKGIISGKVIDKDSKQPIPNVSVQILGTKTGVATDLDGKYIN